MSIHLVRGEMKAVVAVIKTPPRNQWTGSALNEDNDPLLRNFADVRDVFNNVQDLSDVNPQVYISPFLAVITAAKPYPAAVARSLSALRLFLATPKVIPDDILKNAQVFEAIAKAIQECRLLSHESFREEGVLIAAIGLLSTALQASAKYITPNEQLMKFIKDCVAKRMLKLLETPRLRVYTSVTHAWVLMIVFMRSSLKLQMEKFFHKIGIIISSDQANILIEQKELALETLIEIFHIPDFISQMFICYDLDYYRSDVLKDLIKILHDNVFSSAGLFETHHQLSVDALSAIVDHFLKSSEKFNPTERIPEQLNPALEGILDITPEERLKRKEHIIATSKTFNKKPKEGIKYAESVKLFSTDPPLPQEIAKFLLHTPYLDKKQIGLYICERTTTEVLEAFVSEFEFENVRIDEAMRIFLESFRLPGESQDIYKIMHKFSEVYYEANKKDYKNADTICTLAYAIIMLNTDQHNPQVQRRMDCTAFKHNLRGTNDQEDFNEELLNGIYQNVSTNEFVNPAECTGTIRENYEWSILLKHGEYSTNKFLDQITNWDNYELFQLTWGRISSALFFVMEKAETMKMFSKALNCYGKCIDIATRYQISDACNNLIIRLCKFSAMVTGFEAMQDLEEVPGIRHILSYKTVEGTIFTLAENPKIQHSLIMCFKYIHSIDSLLSDSWKNILDIIVQLFRLQLLPTTMTNVEDYVNPKGITIQAHYNINEADNRSESGILAWLGLGNETPPKTQAEKDALKKSALDCIAECHPEKLISDSKYRAPLSLNQLLAHIIQATRLVKDCGLAMNDEKRLHQQYEEIIVFLTELFVSIIIENKDRLQCFWEKTKLHFEFLLVSFGRNPKIAQRAVIGLIRIMNRHLLSVNYNPSLGVLQSLSIFYKLHPPGLFIFSRDIAYGLHDLLRTNAANIHNAEDWRIICILLEAVGAAVYSDEIMDISTININQRENDNEIIKPKFSQIQQSSHERGYFSDDQLMKGQQLKSLEHGSSSISVGSIGQEWVRVSDPNLSILPPTLPSTIIDIQPKTKIFDRGTIVLAPQISRHDPSAFLKTVDTIVFLVRDSVHVTPYNFESCAQCLRSLLEASLDAGKNAVNLYVDEELMTTISPNEDPKQIMKKNEEAHFLRYSQASNQLLDVTFNLYLKVYTIYHQWTVADPQVSASIPFLWDKCWRPLLQGIARLCCDCRRQIRSQALTFLLRALLLPEFVDLQPEQWENCFADVLFPLLLKLLDNLSPNDPQGLEETRVRVIQAVSKVLLNHLGMLMKLYSFSDLFIRFVDYMRRYWNCERSDTLKDAIPETLKNVILILDNSHAFVAFPELYHSTSETLKSFLPQLVTEVMANLPVTQELLEPKIIQTAPTQDDGTNSTNSYNGNSPIPLSSSPPTQPLPTYEY